jgi:hypothetical protein
MGNEWAPFKSLLGVLIVQNYHSFLFCLFSCFFVCSCLSHVLLSFLYSFPYLSWRYYFFRYYDWANNFFQHASTLCGFFRLKFMRSFEADEKIITRNSKASEWCGYFVFIDIPAYRLQNFFFLERPKPHFSVHLKTICNFLLFMERDSSLSTQRLDFYPFQSRHMFK